MQLTAHAVSLFEFFSSMLTYYWGISCIQMIISDQHDSKWKIKSKNKLQFASLHAVSKRLFLARISCSVDQIVVISLF